MKTLAEWIEAHRTVKVKMFEKNYTKESGSGGFETLCGFCLATHYFTQKQPGTCAFCKAPIRDTRSISDLPEILSQRWRLVERARDGGRRFLLPIAPKVARALVALRSYRARKRLATLSPYEDKCWVFAFNYFRDRGKTERQADKLAWRDLQLEFPRLRDYDGCKPSYGMKQQN